MMRTRLLLSALVLSLAAPALAQQAAPSEGEAQALRWFNLLDADGDGRISRAEANIAFRLKPSLKDWFRDADANRDGFLTQTEIRAAADRKLAERRQREAAEQAAKLPASTSMSAQ